MRRRILIGGIAIALAGGALGFLSYIGRLGTNFREVIPGKFYRSGELSPEALKEVIARYAIRSVVNLQSVPKDWERHGRQMEVCAETGAEHALIPLSSDNLPTPASARKLVELIRRGPYPMLVFCREGADRSGLASAAYLAVAEGRPVEEAASSQLSWRCGHFPFLGTGAMDRFFELYKETSGGRDLARWVEELYPAVHARRSAQ
jgi:protein tyrosine/serine phosphatase